jgi:hypothetical protein
MIAPLDETAEAVIVSSDPKCLIARHRNFSGAATLTVVSGDDITAIGRKFRTAAGGLRLSKMAGSRS